MKITKALRDHIAIQCNQLKHNHANLYFIEQANMSGRVPGYVIMSHNEVGALAPHTVIHKSREAFSFSVELRIIFASMYVLGEEVDGFLRKHLSLNPLPMGVERAGQSTIELIDRISNLPTLAFSKEAPENMPFIQFKDNVLHVAMSGGVLFHGWARQWTQLNFSGDGVTTNFVLPLP